jgi:hypothetical protein
MPEKHSTRPPGASGLRFIPTSYLWQPPSASLVYPFSCAMVFICIVHIPSPPPPFPLPHIPPVPLHRSLIPPAWYSCEAPLFPWKCRNGIRLNSGRWRTSPTHLAFPILSGFSLVLRSQYFPQLVSTYLPWLGLPPVLCSSLSKWSPIPTHPPHLIPLPPWNLKVVD